MKKKETGKKTSTLSSEKVPTESSINSKTSKKSKASKASVPVKGKKKDKKELEEEKKKEEQYRKLEDYINNSGLTLAFNIIFAELISKQILPENFFTYTSMRLKQIGKEIEGLKTKVPMYIEKKVKDTENNEENNEENNQENKEAEEAVFLTAQQEKGKDKKQPTKKK